MNETQRNGQNKQRYTTHQNIVKDLRIGTDLEASFHAGSFSEGTAIETEKDFLRESQTNAFERICDDGNNSDDSFVAASVGFAVPDRRFNHGIRKQSTPRAGETCQRNVI